MCARFMKAVSADEECGPDRASVKSAAVVHVTCNVSHRRKDLDSAWILCPLAILRSQLWVYMAPCPLLAQSLTPVYVEKQCDLLWSGICRTLRYSLSHLSLWDRLQVKM